MNWEFFKYFVNYLIKSRKRQRVLIIAVVGLFLSSFSLVVIQGIMGGLQNGLMKRSQEVLGSFSIIPNKSADLEVLEKIKKRIASEFEKFTIELEAELLIKHSNKFTPVYVRGIDWGNYTPPFLLKKDLSGVVLGGELSTKIKAYTTSEIQLISPTSTDLFMFELPRFQTINISDFFMTELFEIDSMQAFTRISFMQNLMKTYRYSRIRFYGEERKKVEAALQEFKTSFTIEKWEDLNKSLVYALKLETTVMIFLFSSMCLLVAICITSGFLIFFNKTKTDLIGFWFLGLTKEKILKLILQFSYWTSLVSILSGLLFGTLVLIFLKFNPIELFPEYFVERSLPVTFTLKQYLLSMLIPFFISFLFTKISFSFFKKENDSFIQLLRSYY
jgi:lipoprotein-releasing system permease protein